MCDRFSPVVHGNSILNDLSPKANDNKIPFPTAQTQITIKINTNENDDWQKDTQQQPDCNCFGTSD